MKVLMCLTLVASIGGVSHAFAAEPRPASACSDALSAVTADWYAIGFLPPSKPAQARVVGNFGHETTAGQYFFLQAELRRARDDCDAGRTASAMKRVIAVRELLGPLDVATKASPDSPIADR